MTMGLQETLMAEVSAKVSWCSPLTIVSDNDCVVVYVSLIRTTCDMLPIL